MINLQFVLYAVAERRHKLFADVLFNVCGWEVISTSQEYFCGTALLRYITILFIDISEQRLKTSYPILDSNWKQYCFHFGAFC